MSVEVTGIAAIGDVLAGKYKVKKILGIGGMGMVVAATHLEIDQRVALKFMLPGSHESPETSDEFAVTKDRQSRGLGARLLAWAEDDIRAHGGRVLFIETSSLPAYEPTRRFYHRHGYERAAHTPPARCVARGIASLPLGCNNHSNNLHCHVGRVHRRISLAADRIFAVVCQNLVVAGPWTRCSSRL